MMTDTQPPGDFRPDGPAAAPAKPKAPKKAKAKKPAKKAAKKAKPAKKAVKKAPKRKSAPKAKKAAKAKKKAPVRKLVRTARLDLRCTPAERALALGTAKRLGLTVTDLVMHVLKHGKMPKAAPKAK